MHFDRVRLRDGYGDVDGLPFCVVEVGQPVAIVVAADEAIAARLQADGFPVVVLVRAEATGAAVADCYAPTAQSLDDAACALCALKTIWGWDESPVMTFRISHAGTSETSWLTTRAVFERGAWSVDVTRAPPGDWSALQSEIEEAIDAQRAKSSRAGK